MMAIGPPASCVNHNINLAIKISKIVIAKRQLQQQELIAMKHNRALVGRT
jgi:hypothetical protein